MKCKNCGRENEANMKFCCGCGSILVEEQPTGTVEANIGNQAFNYNEGAVVEAPAYAPVQATPAYAPVQATPDYVPVQPAPAYAPVQPAPVADAPNGYAPGFPAAEFAGGVQAPAKKNKKVLIIGIIAGVLAAIIAFVGVFAVFSSRSKIEGVSSDTYRECTRIMDLLSSEAYLDEIANKVESAMYAKYGSNWGSVKIAEISNYILYQADIVELADDINDIPKTTEADEDLATFVMFQYAFFMDAAMNKGGATTAFAISAILLSYNKEYGYTFEECQDIYGTFVSKYSAVYYNATCIEDIEDTLKEMAVFSSCTAMSSMADK